MDINTFIITVAIRSHDESGKIVIVNGSGPVPGSPREVSHERDAWAAIYADNDSLPWPVLDALKKVDTPTSA